jgi:hypothetical protein
MTQRVILNARNLLVWLREMPSRLIFGKKVDFKVIYMHMCFLYLTFNIIFYRQKRNSGGGKYENQQ